MPGPICKIIICAGSLIVVIETVVEHVTDRAAREKAVEIMQRAYDELDALLP